MVALGIEDLNAAMRQRIGTALVSVDILRLELRQQILPDRYQSPSGVRANC